MKDLKEFIMLGIIVVLLVYLNMPNEAKFKVKDCVQDSIHNLIREIIFIDDFVYEYKILDYNNDNTYFMRISDFDRIMTPSKCSKD